MTNMDIMRIAVRAGCSPSTVKSCLSGQRKTHPAIANAIKTAVAKLGLSGDASLAKAADVPLCPHEPDGE